MTPCLAQRFVEAKRTWWVPEKRPADHPFHCDFREALGLPRGMRFTAKDVQKHAKQASRWWHPDKTGADGQVYVAFQRAVDVLSNAKSRDAYMQEVTSELEVAEELGRSVDWQKVNVKFLKDMARTVTPRERGSVAPETEIHTLMYHVFLDGSSSMLGEGLMVGKKTLHDLFPSFHTTPTAVHLVASRTGHSPSRLLYSPSEELEFREPEVMRRWSCSTQGTYLWEYVYKQSKDFLDLTHEIIIITDGMDTDSPSPFGGLMGFQELMKKVQNKKIRLSLLLIGNSMDAAESSVYRDLCMATGGVFHHFLHDGDYSLAVHNFVAPLLITEAERLILAHNQQTEYERNLCAGEAIPFDWYHPLTNGVSGRPSDPPFSASASAARAVFKVGNVTVTKLA